MNCWKRPRRAQRADDQGRAFKVHNSNDPYQPHLPHPLSYWLYVTAEVEIRQPPTNPADGEKVTEVLELPLAGAIDYLAHFDAVMADTLRLFGEMSGSEPGLPVDHRQA